MLAKQKSRMDDAKNGRTPILLSLSGIVFGLIALSQIPSSDRGYFDRLFAIAENIGEYFIYAISFFIIFWVILDRCLSGRKLTKKRWPKAKQVISEATFSFSTQFIFIAVAMWLTYLVTEGRLEANAYSELSLSGIPYFIFTLLIIFFVHDTFFYWFHRLMHTDLLFKHIHKTHHESRDPTPFTTFHFHPAEAVLEVLAGKATIIVMLTMPYHESVPAIWVTGMIIFNSIGHLGFEIYPSWWHKVPLLAGKTTATHHYMHHQRVGGNFALYFRFWDQVCGTEFKDYEKRYGKMFEKIKQERKISGSQISV